MQRLIGFVNSRSVFYDKVSETITINGTNVTIGNVVNENDAIVVAKKNLLNFKALKEEA